MGDPGTNTRIAAKLVAGVDMITGGWVIDGFYLAPSIETHVIDIILQVLPLGGNIGSALTCLDKLKGLLTKYRCPDDMALSVSPLR